MRKENAFFPSTSLTFDLHHVQPNHVAPNYEFLINMCVAIVKHRLEILKIVKWETVDRVITTTIAALPRRTTRLLATIMHRSMHSMLSHLFSSPPPHELT
jgi:hypothetical protein